MKKQLLFLAMLLMPMLSWADDSGSCGDGVTYIYKTSTGTLTIIKSGEGTGKMNNYTTTTAQPWRPYYDKIKKVVIGNGVTSIGNYAFYPFLNLANVTIPNSVTSIGEYAFASCETALKSITIPISVTSIGKGAFSSCNSLISINIPNELTTIEANTFEYCTSLKSVNIPNSVKSIGKEAFQWCSSITAITIPNAVTSIEDLTFFSCSSLKSVTIPNTVTNIGSNAFSYSGLNSVIIPNCYIGNAAFHDCKALTSVIVRTSNVSPQKNWEGKYQIFQACDNIKEIVFDCEIARALFRGVTALEKVTLTDNVKSIEQGAFSGCINLTSINIPSSVTNIGVSAFTSCALTSIVVDSDNTYYDSRDNCNAIIETASNTLFTGCQTTIIPNSVTSIGDRAFFYCSNLTSMIIPNSVTSIGLEAFKGCKNVTSITFSESVTSIGEYSFGHCSGLTSITIPNSVVCIERCAFWYCESLISVTIPKSVKTIGNQAFDHCSELTSVTIESNTPIAISSYTFSNRANATLYVPAGSKAAYQAANYWKEFKEIVELPAPPTNITFADANVKAICVANWDSDGDGELSEAEAAEVTDLGELFKGNTTIKSFNELQYFTGLTTIGNSAFSDCSSLSSITIPDVVTSIGEYAFDGCSSLSSITIPSSVTSIGESAFANSGLTSIEFLSSCQIDTYAFSGCYNLNAVYTPSIEAWLGNTFGLLPHTTWANPLEFAHHLYIGGVLLEELDMSNNSLYDYDIGDQAFIGCTDLTRVILNDDCSLIGRDAFRYCTSLVSITVPNSVRSIGERAFAGCRNISEVHISDINAWCNIDFNDHYSAMGGNTSLEAGCSNPLVYGAKLFLNDEEIDDLVIPNTVTSIKEFAFAGLRLNSITIPNTINSIGAGAFYNSSIARLNISDIEAWCKIDFKGINEYSWGWNNSLFEKNEHEVVRTKKCELLMGSNPCGFGHPTVYLNDVELKNLVVPAGIQSIPNYAFCGWNSLESISIPEGVTNIGELAFSYCSNLHTISLPLTLRSIEQGAFAGYGGNCYKSIDFLPSNLKRIGDFAFCGLFLTSVAIPNSVESIGQKAFWECNGVTFSWENPSSVSWADANTGNDFFAWGVTMPNICIPKGTRNLYKNWAPGWADFFVTSADDTTPLQVDDLFMNDGIVYKVTSLNPSTVQVGNGNRMIAINRDRTSCIIPAKIQTGDGKTFEVTSIAACAFDFCNLLKSLTIPRTIVSIDGDFFNCDGLTSVTVENPTPIAIKSNIFSNRANATLYVPKGSKTAYKAADYWKEFKEIVEISTITVYDLSICKGGKNKLSVSMENVEEITAFQFDVEVPQGITVTDVQLGERSSDSHTVDFSKQADGSYRVIAVSLEKALFSGNEGELVSLMLSADKDIESGDNSIGIKNIVLTTTSKEKLYPTDVNSVLTVLNIKQGDADGDGFVDVADVVTMIDYILDSSTSDIVFLAADMNADGEIDIFDVMIAINIVLNRDNSAGSRTRASGNMEEQAVVTATADGIMLGVNDAGRFTAFQFDVEVTDGMELKAARLNDNTGNHELYSINIGQNTYRVIGISMDNSTLTGSGNDLIKLSFSKGGHAQISNLVFVTPQKSKVYFSCDNGEVTGIGRIGYRQAEDIYDLSGRKTNTDRSRLPKGVYIINNKKVVIK